MRKGLGGVGVGEMGVHASFCHVHGASEASIRTLHKTAFAALTEVDANRYSMQLDGESITLLGSINVNSKIAKPLLIMWNRLSLLDICIKISTSW